MLSPQGLKIWLGEIKDFKPEKGFQYKTQEGISGEIRSVLQGKKLRLTWKPKNWPASPDRQRGEQKSSTLQVYLECPRNTPEKTMIRFHQEKLSDTNEREKMRAHWQQVLEKILKLL